MGKYCKYLNRAQDCKHGCTEVNGKQSIVCHRFSRGECKYGDDCRHGLHSNPRRPILQRRGSGFRPQTPDTMEEITLKQHLARLMLSQKCEELLELDSNMLEKWCKMIALKRHPDKMMALESEPDVSRPTRGNAFLQLQMAKEYVMERLPFRIAPGH